MPDLRRRAAGAPPSTRQPVDRAAALADPPPQGSRAVVRQRGAPARRECTERVERPRPRREGALMTDRRNTWTEAADAVLRRLWADGATSGEIAAHFRKTRNAIIGRVHRLHLPPRPSPIPGHVPAKPKAVAPQPLPPVVADPPVHRTP